MLTHKHNAVSLYIRENEIIYFDYSKLKEEELKKQMLANMQYVNDFVRDPALFLVNLEQTNIINVGNILLSSEFKEIFALVQKKIKKQALINLYEGRKSWFVNILTTMIINISNKNQKAFLTRQDAYDWLLLDD